MVSVDITILSWDRLDETKAAILSAVAQKGIDGRVIVFDQGSKPENLAELRRFCRSLERVRVVCSRTNLGVPGGRNQASWQDDGKYIVALDNDAEFVDEFQLAKAVELMEAEPELGVLAFRILRFGSDQDDLSSWSYWQAAAEWSSKTFYTTRFVGAGHMIRRSVFEHVDGYDAALFFLHEEVDLSERIIRSGYKIRYSPDVVIGHKVSAEHRVKWTGARWRFDVRNSLYMNIKLKAPFLTTCFYTLLTLRRGMRAKMFWHTLVGLWQGLMMAPLAFHAWRTGNGINKTAQSRAYTESCSQTQGMSKWQRIKLRVRGTKVAPGKHMAQDS